MAIAYYSKATLCFDRIGSLWNSIESFASRGWSRSGRAWAHVAISAGYYLLAKLGMEQFAELSPPGAVRRGICRGERRPHSVQRSCHEAGSLFGMIRKVNETSWFSSAKPNRREKNMRCVAS